MVEDVVSSMGIMITIEIIIMLTINAGIVIVLTITVIGYAYRQHFRSVPSQQKRP